jgi:predicted acylesterase/phospholipase RssA
MFTNIVFSGGAVKGICYIGCIKYLQEHHLLRDVRNLVGASVGSIFALLICLDMGHEEIRDFAVHLLKCLKGVDIENILDIYNTLGINDAEDVMCCIRNLLEKKTKNPNITFIEFGKKTGKNLVIAASNLITRSIEFISVDTHPDMSIATAIKASIAVPLLFQPVVYKDAIYVDAGLFSNTPYEYCKVHPFVDTLIIEICSKPKKADTTNLNLVDYVELFMQAIYMKLNTKKNLDSGKRVMIKFEDTSVFLGNISDDLTYQIDPELFETFVKKGYDALDISMSSDSCFTEHE